MNDTLPLPLKDFADKQLKRYARKAKRFAVCHTTLTPEERHQMRINFKKLRYSMEFFEPLLDSRQLPTYLSTLSILQDELGLINDLVTAQTLIDDALKNHTPGPVQGWIAGRQALLITNLSAAMESWLENK